MRYVTFGAAVCAVAILGSSSLARANGRFPASNQILFSPASSGTIVVRTTFGIAQSQDAGASWRWLCEDTLGLGQTSNEDPYLALTAGGSLVAGFSLGLDVSVNGGCDWSKAGGALQGQLVKDLVLRADNQHTLDLITSTYGSSANTDGGAGYAQRTFESTDDGAHWTAFGTPIDPSAIVTTIDVAPSDPQRLYVSAFRLGTPRTASLFVSKDKGTTWTEYPAPLDPTTETAVYIGAVDPMHEDVVYLRSEGQSRLSVTRDAGQSFQTVMTLPDQMLGLALSQDGSKVYVGSTKAGLLVAPTSTLSFSQTSKIHVQCLATRGAELWACSDEVSGFIAGVSQDDGKTFTPKLHLLQIEGPVVCNAGSAAAQCTSWDLEGGAFYNPFVSLCSGLGACDTPGAPQPLPSVCACTGACAAAATSVSSDYDASVTCPDAGTPPGDGGDAGRAGDAGKSATSSKGSCGCSVVGASGAFGAFAGGGAVSAAALLWGRRRKRGAGRAPLERPMP